MQLSFFPELTKPIAKFPSTRYQGSKLKFVDWIWEIIKDLPFHLYERMILSKSHEMNIEHTKKII